MQKIQLYIQKYKAKEKRRSLRLVGADHFLRAKILDKK